MAGAELALAGEQAGRNRVRSGRSHATPSGGGGASGALGAPRVVVARVDADGVAVAGDALLKVLVGKVLVACSGAAQQGWMNTHHVLQAPSLLPST